MGEPRYRVQTELHSIRAADEGAPKTIWVYDSAVFHSQQEAEEAMPLIGKAEEMRAFNLRWDGRQRHNTGNFRVMRTNYGQAEILSYYVHPRDEVLEEALREHDEAEDSAAVWRAVAIAVMITMTVGVAIYAMWPG